MTTTMMSDLIHAELTAASRSLHNDHTALIRVARETEGTPVGKLLRRVMEWRRDAWKSVWLHTLLAHVVPNAPTTFMRGLLTFVQVSPRGVKSSLVIDWVGPSGEPLSKDNQRSRPEVRAGSRGLDNLTAQVLLDVMDVYESRQSRHDARFLAMEGMVDEA